MAKGTGILLDKNGDLLVQNGGLVVGDVTAQNCKMLLQASEGEFKESPTKGVGIYKFIEDNTPQNLYNKITNQFFQEGLTIKKISIKLPSVIDIDAEYK